MESEAPAFSVSLAAVVSGASESTALSGTDCSCMDGVVVEEPAAPLPSDGLTGLEEAAESSVPPFCPEDDPVPFERVFLYRSPKAETFAPARGKPEPARADPATPRILSGEKASESSSDEDAAAEVDSPFDAAFSDGFAAPSLEDDIPLPASPPVFAFFRSEAGEPPWVDIGSAPEADLPAPDDSDLPWPWPCSEALEASPVRPAAPWMPMEAAAPAMAAAAPTVAAPAAPERIRPSVPGMKSAICLINVKGKMDDRIMPTTAMRVVVVDPDTTMSLHVTQMHRAMTGCMRMMPAIQPAHLDTNGRMVLQPWSMMGIAAMTMAKIRRKLRAAIINSRTKLPRTMHRHRVIVISALSKTSSESLLIPGTLPPREEELRMLFVIVVANAVPLTARVMHSTVNGQARAVRAAAETTAPISCTAAARRMP